MITCHAIKVLAAGLVFGCLAGAQALSAQQRPVQIASGSACATAEPLPSSDGAAGSQVVPTVSVPRAMRFGGVARDSSGQLRTGLVGITFAIYADQEGGPTMWMETHNVELDQQGRYSVLLGSRQSAGMPLELFATGEPRWLGVKVELPGEVEQPRVLLVSVPYALKAADADTLGGKPSSAYVLAPAASVESTGASGSGATSTNKSSAANAVGITPAATINGSGTLNQVAKFTPDGVTIGNSAISEVNGNVGIGLTPPANQQLLIGVGAGKLALNMSNLTDQDLQVSVSAPGAADRVGIIGTGVPTNLALQVGGAERMRITNAGNVGIGLVPPANQRLSIAVPPGAIALNMTNNADQDLFVSISSPGAADKVGIIGPGQPTNLGLQVGGAEKVRITNGGNVGIGTKTPSQSLEVNGNVKVNGGTGVIFPDGSSMASANTVNGNLTVTGGVTTVTGLVLRNGTTCSQITIDAMGNPIFTKLMSCP